jgi:hypothetical protein
LSLLASRPASLRALSASKRDCTAFCLILLSVFASQKAAAPSLESSCRQAQDESHDSTWPGLHAASGWGSCRGVSGPRDVCKAKIAVAAECLRMPTNLHCILYLC